MKFIFLLSFFTLLCKSPGIAQMYGYFGKKNIVSINVLGSTPIIYRAFSTQMLNFQKSGSGVVEKHDMYDVGLNLSFSHAFSGKFAVGFDYTLQFGNIHAPRLGHTYYTNEFGQSNTLTTVFIKHEQLEIHSNIFMPKIEYTFVSTQLPIGFNNQIGVGYSTTKVIEKDYNYEVVGFGYYDGVSPSDTIYNPERSFDYDELQSIKGISFLYAFNIRTPLSKHLVINYGLRYTLNLTFTQASTTPITDFNTTYSPDSSNEFYYFDANDIKNEVGNKRISSILSLNLGLSYVF